MMMDDVRWMKMRILFSLATLQGNHDRYARRAQVTLRRCTHLGDLQIGERSLRPGKGRLKKAYAKLYIPGRLASNPVFANKSCSSRYMFLRGERPRS